MKFSPLAVLLTLLSLLFGCSRKSAFTNKGGRWYFEELLIEGVDAGSFTPLPEHYAQDRQHAYFCATYREGKDLFTSKKVRVTTIQDAEVASFKVLKNGYARDARRLYFEGVEFPVQDHATFEILEYGYARDRFAGYYLRNVVPGSEGSTFAAVDSHYSKDRKSVFHSDLAPGPGGPYLARSFRLSGADPVTFTALEPGYAVDAGQGYFRGKVLTREVASFRALSFGYAKSATEVFSEGERIAGADAPSFATLESPTDSADAKDARAEYQQGKKVKR